jgi:ACS family tartrate transporter-like MFS transporter
VGARLWIARIMIAWGLLAGATPLVTGSTSFAAVRFLGVAEAGFFPGIILYFTYWFPSRHHARIVSGFLIENPSLRSVRRSASSAAARLSSRRPAVARTSAKSPRNGV